MTDGVHRYLVTAGDERLVDFHWRVTWYANGLERRDQTVLYTVYAGQAPAFLAAATQADVTVQQIHGAGDEESYTDAWIGSEGRRWTPSAPPPNPR